MVVDEIGSGDPLPLSAPQFWELPPIVLPPLPSPCTADAKPEEEPPILKAVRNQSSLEVETLSICERGLC